MQWLNYHHLLYFWVVAKEGSIVGASKVLHLAHPTISGQIHRLEEVLGEKLFQKKGRALVLTEIGRVAFRYAEEIFSLGQEFLDTIGGRSNPRTVRLVVGVSDVFAKSIVYRILEPVFYLEEEVRVVCREDRSLESFLGELATHAVDVLLSDAPITLNTAVKVYSHPLGECGTAFFAAPKLAKVCKARFPHSLDGVPFLIPGANSTLRRALDEWFSTRDIRPRIIAELDDAALANVLGEAGLGVFAVPDVIEKEIQQRYDVRLVGRVRDIRHAFYAISVERKIKHPAVAAICEVARKKIFAN